MDTFPQDFNLQNCFKRIEHNQKNLIKDVRQDFYNLVQEGVEKCEKKVELHFPDKLWSDNRNILVSEMIDRFGELEVKSERSAEVSVTECIHADEPLPKNVSTIILELWS